MPYANFPKSIPTEKIDKCVHDVMGKGHDKPSSIAICYASMVKGKELSEVMKEFTVTEKASDSPSDYLIVEDSKMPTTWHLQVKKNGKIDHGLMGSAWAALHGGYRGNKYEGPNKGEAISKLRKMYEDEGMPMPMEKEISELETLKQADGHYRWIGFSSSSYEDRDNEIVSQKALEADTERMNASGDFGITDWWHTPAPLASCDVSYMNGCVSIESGVFYDDWVGEQFSKMKGLGMSRTFYNPANEPDANGVYHNIKTFRRAILPAERASNRLTMVDVSAKEEGMTVADKVRELADRFMKVGVPKETAESKAKELIEGSDVAQQAAAAANLKQKEVSPSEVVAETNSEQPKTETQKGGDPESTPTTDAPKTMFVGDMTPDEFEAHLTKAVEKFLTPAVKEISAQVAKMNEAQATTAKEQGDKVATSIKSVQEMQTDLAARLAAIEGLTPRAYRATQDPNTTVSKETAKEKAPKGDEQADKGLSNWLASWQ